MPNDQALLLQYATSRDADAFKQLVRRYSTLVYSIACRVTGNRTTAEDVTQDCFFALARQAASIKGSLPAWLHRVALNLSLNVTRDEARHDGTKPKLPSCLNSSTNMFGAGLRPWLTCRFRSFRTISGSR